MFILTGQINFVRDASYHTWGALLKCEMIDEHIWDFQMFPKTWQWCLMDRKGAARLHVPPGTSKVKP